jgi:dolichyl-diphosphooligosaccharide--protein glycosyltransferase
MVKGVLVRLGAGLEAEEESGRKGLAVAVLACLAAILVSLGLRFLEVPEWSADKYFAAGERLLATHDAYAWLAGAKGTSRYVLGPLSQLLAFLHTVTGISLGSLGFWLPVVFGPLVVLPVAVLAWRMNRPEAGAVAGVMAAGSFGFLLRTRVGYLDTDVLTLFFAAATTAALSLWLAPLCRPGWLPDPESKSDGAKRLEQPLWITLGLAGLLGLFLRLYTVHFYSSGRPIVWALLLTALGLGIILGRPGLRGRVLLGLALVLAVWLLGLPGLALGLAAVALAWARPSLVTPGRTLAAGAAVLGVILVVHGTSDMAAYWALVKAYLRPSSAEQAGAAVGGTLDLPSVIASVREATTAKFSDVVNLTSVHWSLFAAALAGLALALARRPLLGVWLPLLGLGLAGFKLGVRFTMYAGPALGLGLGLGLAELLALFGVGRRVRWSAQVVLLAVVGWTLTVPLRELYPFPVLSKPFAETLAGLRGKLPKDAMLWQWWDFGYAAQYYAERDTFGDGGRHDGQFLYPLALVHATSSPMQAAQMMKFVAATLAEQRQEEKDRGVAPYPPAQIEYYPEHPMARLEAMGREKASQFVQSLASEPQQWPAHLPEQYLVLAWDDFILGGWISRYGSWSLAQGAGAPGRISPLRGQVNIDPQKGSLRTPQGQAALSEMTVIDEQGRIGAMLWARTGGVYVVMNRITNEVFVMERSIYESMMVRMLLGDPKDFEPYFELVAENAPWCRVYRVR